MRRGCRRRPGYEERFTRGTNGLAHLGMAPLRAEIEPCERQCRAPGALLLVRVGELGVDDVVTLGAAAGAGVGAGLAAGRRAAGGALAVHRLAQGHHLLLQLLHGGLDLGAGMGLGVGWRCWGWGGEVPGRGGEPRTGRAALRKLQQQRHQRAGSTCRVARCPTSTQQAQAQQADSSPSPRCRWGWPP